MFEIGGQFYKWFQYLAPITIIICSVILVASITKGYRGFIMGIKEILQSKWSLLFFVVVVIMFFLMVAKLESWIFK
jgi:hypothetical protein